MEEIREEAPKAAGTEDREQDLLAILEQMEITDLGELSMVAWRVI